MKCVWEITSTTLADRTGFIPEWARFSLYDLGQVKPPLWLSISLSVKWTHGYRTRWLRHPQILFLMTLLFVTCPDIKDPCWL